ncbi:hypothetical protein JW824_07460 [bacterium]|nr:hypothetical protein [bacterium]RQV95063.1 MAG: hypothetical protein EH221_06850 [bacterium]
MSGYDIKVNEKLFPDVVHKIKNSLGGIGGFATLLEKDLGSKDPRIRLVKRIQTGVVKLNELIINLTTLISLSKPSLKKVQLQSIIRSAWRNLFEEDDELNALMTAHSNDKNGAIELYADPYLMGKLFFHAIQFTQLVDTKIEKIDITSQSEACIRVTFYLLKNSTSGNLKGNITQMVNSCEPVEARLSLAIVLKMVELHQGRVSFNTKSGDRRILSIQLLKGKE